MSEIVWTLHSQHEMLESLLAYLREQSREFLQPLDINYEIDFPDEVPAIKLSGEQRHNLLLVTKEALNNAVKYAQAEHITLSCSVEKNKIVFKVADDGVGFIATDVNGKGNGLKNMQRRMKAINGAISWHQPGKGACVIYSVPV